MQTRFGVADCHEATGAAEEGRLRHVPGQPSDAALPRDALSPQRPAIHHVAGKGLEAPPLNFNTF